MLISSLPTAFKRRALLLAIFALGQLSPTIAAEINRDHQVTDRAYGQALYHHFQQNNLRAITALMVADRRQQTNRQKDQSDLLLADLYYQYGLYDESDQLFSRLLADDIDRSLLPHLWFNLARLNHDQGKHEKALELLLRIETPLAGWLQNEKQYLLSKLFVINDFIDDARIAIEAIDRQSIWYHYARYNLGVSLLENGKFDEGVSILNTIGQLQDTGDELSALRDQANLAVGLSHLRINKPKPALQSLQRIRLQGPVSHTTLLATGWAWTQLGDSGKAFVPWLELASKNSVDAATQEALLAIPSQLEQSNSPKLAIQYYTLAVAQFEKQIKVLNQSIEKINAGELISLLSQNALISGQQEFAASSLPSDSAPYLHIVFASADYQQALKRFEELIEISSMLNNWEKKLPTLYLKLKERRQKFISERPLLEQNGRFESLAALRILRDNFAFQIKQVENNLSSLELHSEKQKTQLGSLQKVGASLDRTGDLRDTSEERDMYRLASGLVNWQIRTSHASRLWAAKNQVKQLDQTLADASSRVETLKRISTDSENRFDEFEARINAQQNKIAGLLSRSADLIERQGAEINELAIDILESQKQHLNQLMLNSRYALTRLYDKMENK